MDAERGRIRRAAAFAAACAVAMTSGTTAQAGTGWIDGSTLRYDAAPGETNGAGVYDYGTHFIIAESIAPLQAGPGCTLVTQYNLHCPSRASRRSRCSLDDQDDLFGGGTRGSGSYTYSVDTGPGATPSTARTSRSAPRFAAVLEMTTSRAAIASATSSMATTATTFSRALIGSMTSAGTTYSTVARATIVSSAMPIPTSCTAARVPTWLTTPATNQTWISRSTSFRTTASRESWTTFTPTSRTSGGSSGHDWIVGDDDANELDGWWGDDAILGGIGNDNLHADDGADALAGGDGDDLLEDMRGPPLCCTVDPDFFHGGAGQDRILFTGRGEALEISLDDIANDGAPGEGDNVHSNIEHVVGGVWTTYLSGAQLTRRLTAGRVTTLWTASSGLTFSSEGRGSTQRTYETRSNPGPRRP